MLLNEGAKLLHGFVGKFSLRQLGLGLLENLARFGMLALSLLDQLIVPKGLGRRWVEKLFLDLLMGAEQNAEPAADHLLHLGVATALVPVGVVESRLVILHQEERHLRWRLLAGDQAGAE